MGIDSVVTAVLPYDRFSVEVRALNVESVVSCTLEVLL
jgi:hypothetical protein